METSELLKKVRRIEIKTRGLSRNIFAGQYHSAFKGRGMAFSEVREYQYGDDIRDIDWNVTARYVRPYVKVFEEERELTVMLLIDVSGSRDFGSVNVMKKEVITEIAATLAFSAIQNNDKIGVVFFSDKIEKFIPPQKGKKHLAVALAELLHRCRLDGGDRLVREFFTIHVDNVEIRVVLLDLNFDGVQQMRLAQTRRPVDEQRVVRAGGVRGHGLRGGKRKLVRRPLDEVLERELVPPAGQVVLVQFRLLGSLAAVRCGRGQHKLQLHLKAEDRGKRLLEQIGIARRRKPHDDVVGNLQDDDVRALKIQQIEVLDENSV